MTTTRGEVHTNDQQGYSTSTGTYVAATANMSFAADQYLYYRFPIDVPKGATINSATLRLPFSVKTETTAQSSFHTIYLHNSGNSPSLVPGVNETGRATGAGSVAWNPTWASTDTGRKVDQINVNTLISNLIARSDYQTGGYVTFLILCTNENGSDMNLSTTYDSFAEKVALHIDYTENVNLPTRWNINRIHSSAFVSSIGDDWGGNPLYGAHTDTPPTTSLDLGMRRTTTNGAMKITLPAPQETRSTGVITYITDMSPNGPWTFSGWLYVPSYVTSQVDVGFAYQGIQFGQVITERDTWVPFCTPSYTNSSGNPGDVVLVMPMVQIRSPFVAGWEIWLSEPACYLSNGPRQMPWTGTTPSDSIVSHYHTGPTDDSRSVRTWIPKTTIPGQTRPSPSYRLHESGLFKLSEPRPQ